MITISSCLITGGQKGRRGRVTELFVLVFLLHRKQQTPVTLPFYKKLSNMIQCTFFSVLTFSSVKFYVNQSVS